MGRSAAPCISSGGRTHPARPCRRAALRGVAFAALALLVEGLARRSAILWAGPARRQSSSAAEAVVRRVTDRREAEPEPNRLSPSIAWAVDWAYHQDVAGAGPTRLSRREWRRHNWAWLGWIRIMLAVPGMTAEIVDEVNWPELREALGDGESHVLAAVARGRIVGAAMLRRAVGGEVRIGLLCADPSLERQGLGRSLLAAAEGYARDVLGAEAFAMSVHDSQRHTLAMYRGAGYRPEEGNLVALQSSESGVGAAGRSLRLKKTALRG